MCVTKLSLWLVALICYWNSCHYDDDGWCKIANWNVTSSICSIEIYPLNQEVPSINIHYHEINKIKKVHNWERKLNMSTAVLESHLSGWAMLVVLITELRRSVNCIRFSVAPINVRRASSYHFSPPFLFSLHIKTPVWQKVRVVRERWWKLLLSLLEMTSVVVEILKLLFLRRPFLVFLHISFAMKYYLRTLYQ